ncbi:SACOL1771 family peroxiredoxin [Staphylococcus simiae]|uniref:OsmC/Ohr family protein n=1 Tax=Staphylococcus simiae CCM 7213 = CCUG 51256 TaxID=911238 RepID=G5JI76_9STAP|nr:SACOL1771 family peroxiredoxin [Staphylococcus simiae]EHJ08111.1 OsmC/Ohr family protein [Staphylococcus simiae CCM 7213 = CCUG 51256]PNZ12114.1 peroxiredoxin [Staphylococcus simiae]SNV74587.1 OsmC-like protein [Staphylococcus simiae]
MVQHDFKVTTMWSGGRNQVGKVNGDILSEHISIPSSLGGIGKGTNPDEMLVAAASSCYIISLAATLERAKFENVTIELESIGTATFINGKFAMKSINHYPKIQIDNKDFERLTKKLPKLLQIADQNCMISNSVRNNVKINISPTITT